MTSLSDTLKARTTILQAEQSKDKLEKAIFMLVQNFQESTGMKVMDVHLQWDVAEVATVDQPDNVLLTFKGVKLTVEL